MLPLDKKLKMHMLNALKRLKEKLVLKLLEKIHQRRYNKIRDLFKVKLYAIRSETKRERERERESEREREK